MPPKLDWGAPLPSSLRALFPTPPTRSMRCAEIGSCSGEGALVIEDYLCGGHPESRLYCVDPWDDVYVRDDPTGILSDFDHLCKDQYARFVENTAGREKIVQMRGTSDAVIPDLPGELDFAYVDGNHDPDQVCRDGLGVLQKVGAGGVVLFDDYGWAYRGLRTKLGIDRVVEEWRDRTLIVLKTEQQLALRVTRA